MTQQASRGHAASRAERWLSTLPRLADPPLQVSFARAELYDASPGDAAGALNDICFRAEETDSRARDVLGAFVPTLVDVEHLDRIWCIRATALASNLLSVGRLLRASTPEGHLLERAREGGSVQVMQRSDGRPLSLGERRALARSPSRATLDKLMRDPHPMVARIVLGNPRITEVDVIRMAAFRPAVPQVVGEITKAWSRSNRVRMAIVLNPGSPPGLAVPLLSLLLRPELQQVSQAADLPAVTRATAHELYEIRPPLAHREPPMVKH